MSSKLFTVQEANAMLTTVDQELRKIQTLKRDFEAKYMDLRRLKNEQAEQVSGEKDPFFFMETELEFLQIEAKSLIQGFQLKGVELKDIDTGLVDFPCIIDGQEVLLCWKQGEDAIRYYHSRHEGFAGRKPISE
ncbi:DUF2203 domain-containing protein [Paenibacillus sp. SYP-B3998]|uniref:DUF2203 domain-containing protein n=1 Tax=Paenibacillus sp. SYP-B3998 TaxID=2678564 RepID=A0A6G4A1I4_9BACL|nr:DUF2203 domain-containing protein [Paenibacillus sp. SYP-B3998]NEW08158.1 DUF2203 domain-containing protein [Paenibacillus sp. SYP-B3998]